MNMRYVKGVGIAEVLVSLLLSVTVIGGSLWFHIQTMREAQFLQQVDVAQSAMNEILMVHDLFWSGHELPVMDLASDQTISTDECDEGCDAASFIAHFIALWQDRLVEMLPGARFRVVLEPDAQSAVSITWVNRHYPVESGGACLLGASNDPQTCLTHFLN